MTWRLPLCLLGAALLASAALAADAVPVPPAQAAPPAPPKAAPVTGPVIEAPAARDAQDLVFFGDAQPVLLRLHVQVNGQPHSAAWDEFVGKLFAHYDLDGDGVLNAKEMARVFNYTDLLNLLNGQLNGRFRRPNNGDQQYTPPSPEELDTNKDGKVTREELAAYYRRAGAGGLSAQMNQRRDAGSGKLTTALFQQLDLNKDGKLSQEELAAAPVSLGQLDLNEDEVITPDELLPQSGPQYELIGGAMPALPRTSPFVLLTPAAPLTPLAQQLLSRYDRDHDGKLSRTEIGLDQEAFDRLDSNHDGKLDRDELVRWFGRPADLEMVVRLGSNKPPNGKTSIFQPLLELGDMMSKRLPVDTYNPGGRKMPLSVAAHKDETGLTLTLNDSIIEWQRGQEYGFGGDARGIKQYYVQQFKALDKDKKGYLERKDLAMDQQGFLMPLFAAADRDGDGKLTEKEFTDFLDLEAQGASSLIHLRVADQGRGLFELLDGDGDGRLSVRELRTAWTRLAPWDHDHDGQLSEAEVPHRFLVTFGQGQLGYPFQAVAFASFGRNAGRPRPPKGPAWFRKMDRNGDGDVSLREWLGTEEEFRRIDTDGDGLISAEEAERYDAQRQPPKKSAKP